MSVYRLRKLYFEHKIKRRVLRVKIKMTDLQLRNQRESRMRCFPRILGLCAEQGKAKVLFMDEAVFTTNQVKPTIWFGRQKEPLMIEKKKLSFKAIAVAAATDRHGKVVAYISRPKSID